MNTMKEASTATRTKNNRFKQTEVGLIPEDWDIRFLPELAWFQEGPGLRNWQFKKTGIKVVNITNMVNGTLDLDRTDRHISTDELNKMYKHFLIDDGDILMASSGNSYGKISIASAVHLPLLMNTSVIRFKNNQNASLQFLKSFLSSPYFKTQIDLMITGGAQPNFGPAHLKKVIVAAPSLPEQTAIAQALSDADALIAGLEKLIEKKKKIKQGAMQELLRPKEGWVKKKLGDLAEIVMGQSPLSKYYNSKAIGLPLIQGNADILNRKTIIRNYTAVITKKGRSGDIIMSVRAPVGEVSRATFDCCLGRGVCAIRFPNDYLYHYLVFFENNWSKVSTGSTFESVNAAQVQDVYIDLPKFESIQIEIASTLSDMDNEISTLNGKLSKAVLTKQGMMQNLLTGKIRLV